jgi:hypothetical protein
MYSYTEYYSNAQINLKKVLPVLPLLQVVLLFSVTPVTVGWDLKQPVYLPLYLFNYCSQILRVISEIKLVFINY